jgi:aryl-alcohol dehydrogenase-like predicted oxidoreductase
VPGHNDIRRAGKRTRQHRNAEVCNDNGITFFDTANIYCKGESEKIVGKALKPIRNHVILATKLGGRMGDGVNAEGLSRYNIIRSVEESLKRLDTDWIDLYYMHVPDERTSYYETMEAMSRLEESGKIDTSV